MWLCKFSHGVVLNLFRFFVITLVCFQPQHHCDFYHFLIVSSHLTEGRDKRYTATVPVPEFHCFVGSIKRELLDSTVSNDNLSASVSVFIPLNAILYTPGKIVYIAVKFVALPDQPLIMNATIHQTLAFLTKYPLMLTFSLNQELILPTLQIQCLAPCAYVALLQPFTKICRIMASILASISKRCGRKIRFSPPPPVSLAGGSRRGGTEIQG